MDKYLSYLRAKLRGKVDMIVTEDIVAHPEGQVADKGDVLNTEQFLRLSQLNLNTPLASCVKIAKPLTPSAIYKEIGELVSKDKPLNEIDEHFGKASLLDQCCDSLKQYPDLLEILTIFKIETEDLYKQSLTSAYFSYILGAVAKYSQAKIESAFLAGVLHDIGLLFIPRNCLDKTKN